MNIKLITLLVVILSTTTSARKSKSDEDGGFILDVLLKPFLTLIENSSTRLVNNTRKTIALLGSQSQAVRNVIQQITSDIGRNALGNVIDNMRTFRGRVRRLLDVVRGAQRSIQSLMENDKVTVPLKGILGPFELAMAGLEGNVAGLNALLDPPTNINFIEQFYPIKDEE